MTTYKDIIKNMFEEYWGLEEYEANFEEIEHKSRDGFICASHNKGGYTLTGFTNVFDIVGSGKHPSHEQAAEDIDRQCNYHLDCVAESAYEHFKELFDTHNLSERDAYYNKIQELAETNTQFSEVLSYIEDAEQEGTSDMSVMYQLRCMYHGRNEEGKLHASISAAVNTEGPYHRSFISWSPHVFCEGAKEIEIEYANEVEFRTKLEEALEQVTKAIF